jgi:hypothetical protein
VGARHRGEVRDAFQTYRDVTEFGKHLEVAPGPAAKIEYRETRLTLDVLQQRRDVLADVVIARAFPEIFGTLVVMFQREAGDFFRSCGLSFMFFMFDLAALMFADASATELSASPWNFYWR